MDDVQDAYAAQLERAEAVLPAWFVPRMMDDSWSYGLLLSSGAVLVIEVIDAVRQAADGSIWIDVSLHTHEFAERLVADLDAPWRNVLAAPTSRTKASVNAAHVVCAVELADT